MKKEGRPRTMLFSGTGTEGRFMPSTKYQWEPKKGEKGGVGNGLLQTPPIISRNMLYCKMEGEALNSNRRREPGCEDTKRSRLAIRLRHFILLVQVCADSRKCQEEERHQVRFF